MTNSPDISTAQPSGKDTSDASDLEQRKEEERQFRALVGGKSQKKLSRRPSRRNGVNHTRISGAWAALVVAVLFGVALIDFIVENTRTVRVDFFGASGHLPVTVALLGAALAGAVVVLTVGICRTTQLRLVLRHRRNGANSTVNADEAIGDTASPVEPTSE